MWGQKWRTRGTRHGIGNRNSSFSGTLFCCKGGTLLEEVGRNFSKLLYCISFQAAARSKSWVLAPPLLNSSVNQRNLNNVQKQRWCSQLVRRFSTEAAGSKENSETQEVAVSEGGKKSKLFPRRRRRGSGSLWRRNNSDFAPALWENLPSGLGNALLQATENINRILENLNLSPTQLMGRYKEDEKSYKIRYDLPGLSKEDVKITVENGVVTIKGEHKEEQEEGSDDEFWSSSRSYGYYNNSIVLPEDAKVHEIKAEMKDGVLTILIPKTEIPKKDVKEIQVM